MRKSSLALILFLLFGWTAAYAAPVMPSAPQMTAQDVNAWLDGIMPSTLKGHDVAGAVVVVVKDGKVLTQRGYGFADVAKRTPFDPASTLFRPGSISKLFTWTAVMQLVEQGKIDLDKDINTYLDFRVDGRNGKTITMRHLMTHRAGFEDTGKDIFTYDPKHNVSNEQRLKAFIPKRIADPGQIPAYSNYGSALAGYIVQRVSGMLFDTYIEQAIFQPLGMMQSSFRQPLPQNLAAHMSKGYLAGSDPALPYEYISIGPAGSLASTGTDMARFMIAHLQNGQLLMRPETAQLMHNTATETAPGLNRMMLGFYETNLNGHRIISHGGDTIQFHSNLHLFLDDNVGLFMSFNSYGSKDVPSDPRDIVLHGFAERYFPGNSGAIKIDPRDAVKDASLVAGHYAISKRNESSFFALPNIFLTLPISANADGSILVNLGRGNQRYVHVGPMLWASTKDGALFGAKLENGVVKTVAANPYSAIFTAQPVPFWRSGAVTIPAIIIALLIYAITALSWPVSALAQRYYNVSSARSGASRRSYIASRMIAWATFVLLAAWMFIFAQIDELVDVSAATLISLQMVSAIVGIASVAVAVWRIKLCFVTGQGWIAKIGAVVLLAASLFIVWAAWMGGVYAMTANY
jgi:CubicO group peptidase (beta-lactamase class C family)